MRHTLGIAVVALFALTGQAYAQESNIAVLGGLRNSFSMGYKPNNIMTVVDTDIRIHRFNLSGRFLTGKTPKSATNDGVTVGGELFLRFYLSGNFFIAPGVVHRYYRTSRWEKTSLNPAWSFGFNYRDLFVPSFTMDFRDPLSDNHGRGGSVQLDFYSPLGNRQSGHWGLKSHVGFGVWRYNHQDTANPIFHGRRIDSFVGVYYRF